MKTYYFLRGGECTSTHDPISLVEFVDVPEEYRLQVKGNGSIEYCFDLRSLASYAKALEDESEEGAVEIKNVFTNEPFTLKQLIEISTFIRNRFQNLNLNASPDRQLIFVFANDLRNKWIFEKFITLIYYNNLHEFEYGIHFYSEAIPNIYYIVQLVKYCCEFSRYLFVKAMMISFKRIIWRNDENLKNILSSFGRNEQYDFLTYILDHDQAMGTLFIETDTTKLQLVHYIALYTTFMRNDYVKLAKLLRRMRKNFGTKLDNKATINGEQISLVKLARERVPKYSVFEDALLAGKENDEIFDLYS